MDASRLTDPLRLRRLGALICALLLALTACDGGDGGGASSGIETSAPAVGSQDAEPEPQEDPSDIPGGDVEGPDDADHGTAEQSLVDSDDLEEPADTEEEQTEPAPPDSDDPPSQVAQEPAEYILDDEEEHIPGEIALSWTAGPVQSFTFVAEHCYVGDDYIMAEGVGGPIDNPVGAIVKIFTSPAELLHEATGTFQGAGEIRLIWEGREIVADARMIHKGEYPQTANLTYRHTIFGGVKYVLSWFEGRAESGAGAVEIQCNYDEVSE